MTNIRPIPLASPLVKLVIRHSHSGLVQVVAKYDKFITTSETIKTKVISKISVLDVKNPPFFGVGEKGDLILGKPEFCESVKEICEELRIIIESLAIRTMYDDSSFYNKMIFIQTLDDIDSKSPEWEATFAKQVEMVAKLLDGTVVE